MWSDDECELLLNVTHEYKVKQLMNGTDWESVRSKYSDILELFKKEIPEVEEGSRLLKDYPHQKEEVTKEIITAKLKSTRTKFRQVCVSVSLCIFPVCVSVSLYIFLTVCDSMTGKFSCWCRLWIQEGEAGTVELYINFMTCVRRYGVAVQQPKELILGWRHVN